MADQPEARIVLRRDQRGNTELSVYEPERMREHRTGWSEHGRKAEESIQKLKDTLERSGNRVTVKEM